MELVFTEYLLKTQKTPLIHRMKFEKYCCKTFFFKLGCMLNFNYFDTIYFSVFEIYIYINIYQELLHSYTFKFRSFQFT